MNWFIYTILSYAAVSVANITDKFLVDKHIKDSSTIVLFTGVVAFLVGIVVFIVRGFPTLSSEQLVFVLAAGVFLQMFLLPYFRALELEDASTVVPLFRVGPVFAFILAYVFLHEVLSGKQLFGFLIIVTSSLVLSLTSKAKRVYLNRAFWLMMLSSFLFAIATVLFKFVVDLGNVWDAIAYEGFGIGLGTLIIFVWPGYVRRFIHYAKHLKPTAWTAMGISEVFYVVYRLGLSLALATGPVSLISVLGGFQPVFVFVYSIFLSIFFPSILKEALDKRTITKKLVAFTGMFIGLYFIYA